MLRRAASAATSGPGVGPVCVVADHFWQAKRAVDALDVVFDGGSEGSLSTPAIDAKLNAALDGSQAVPALVRGQPDDGYPLWRRVGQRSRARVAGRPRRMRRSSHSRPTWMAASTSSLPITANARPAISTVQRCAAGDFFASQNAMQDRAQLLHFERL
mgnify:CR=1 FL=1